MEQHEAAEVQASPKATALDEVRKQARRYLEARYGKDVWFRAPETFENLLERWIWAVASGAPELAEECMADIERFWGERDG